MASLHLPETNLTRAEIPYCGTTGMVQTNTLSQDPLDFGKKLSIVWELQVEALRLLLLCYYILGLFFDGIRNLLTFIL